MANAFRIKNEIDHFSKLDHIWWGALTKAGQARYDDKAEKLIKLTNPKKNMKILEIGCGDGEFTKRLLTISSNIVATDITPEVIKRARNKIKSSKVKFMVDNAEKLKFKKDSFDIVCGVSILHHINLSKSLKEVYRVLKPGGQMFFTEPNILNPVIMAGLNVPFLRKRMEFSEDETALNRKEVELILKKAGFKYVAVTNYDFLFPKTPENLISTIKILSNILENTPLIKEISGSLILYAIK